MTSYKSPHPKKFRQRAVQMVSDLLPELEMEWSAIITAAARLGVGSAETVRKWIRQAEVDTGKSSGADSEDVAEIGFLREENAWLRRVIEMQQTPGSAQIVDAEEKALEPAKANSGDQSTRQNEAESEYRAIDQLNKDLLKKRLSDLFPAGYLTLMAIVQGVALAIVLEEVDLEVFSGPSAVHRFTAASQALGTFVAIVVITHRYFLLTGIERWRPTHIDTLLPYALGTSEAVMAFFIGNNAGWWTALSILFFVASASFINSMARRNPAMYEEDLQPLYEDTQRGAKLQLIECLGFALLSACVALVTIYSTILPSLFYALAPYPVIATVGAIEVKGNRQMRKVLAHYGIQ